MSGFPYDKADMFKGLGGGGLSKPTPNPSNLAASLVAVMSEVGTMARAGHNDFSNYDFTTVETVVKTLRPLLIKNGLALIPHNVSVTSENFGLGKDGKMARVAISATYLLMHISGESITITVPGEGMDSLDKSTAKALTGALKYALLQTFCIDRGEDGDAGKGYEADVKAAIDHAIRYESAIMTTPPARENEELRKASNYDPGPPDFVMPFGDYKGMSPAKIPNDKLGGLIAYVERQLKDAAKAKFAGKNKQMLDALLYEMQRRAANAQEDQAPLDDDIPF